MRFGRNNKRERSFILILVKSLFLKTNKELYTVKILFKKSFAKNLKLRRYE